MDAEEVTFECEPGTLAEPKVHSLKALGMTRISLGVENFDDAILEANGEGKMVLWSPSPKKLKRYFGPKISVRDVWGRNVPVDQWTTDLGPIQSFEVGDWPVIVEGVDLHAIRWQMGLELLTKQVDLIVGKQEVIEIQIDNPFDFAFVRQPDNCLSDSQCLFVCEIVCLGDPDCSRPVGHLPREIGVV